MMSGSQNSASHIIWAVTWHFVQLGGMVAIVSAESRTVFSKRSKSLFRARKDAAVNRLAPLRERNFRRFYAGYVTSLLGTSMSGVALVFAVLGSGGTATDLGYVQAARIVPQVVFVLGAGVLADRLGRRSGCSWSLPRWPARGRRFSAPLSTPSPSRSRRMTRWSVRTHSPARRRPPPASPGPPSRESSSRWPAPPG